MLGYLIGKIVLVSGTILISRGPPADCRAWSCSAGLRSAAPVTWLTLAWVLALGLLATLPIGAVLGSLFPSRPQRRPADARRSSG